MAIISFRHDFIFVKTTKTAGTSLEVELSKLVEPEAVVTPIVPEEPGHKARNYKRGLLKKAYFNHMPAARIRHYLGDAAFFSKYRFCIERDPITKCISHFHMLAHSPIHRAKGGSPLDWSDYVGRGDFPIDTDKYVGVVDGVRTLLVDEVVAYENMAAELTRIGERVGIGPIGMQTRAKSDYSRQKLITPAEVTDAQREIIFAAFAESLAFSGLGPRYGFSPAEATAASGRAQA